VNDLLVGTEVLLVTVNGDTSDNSVAYRQDGCDALLPIVPGRTFADVDAVAISAGHGQTISVNGHHAVKITWLGER
jgi:hypothetical protein